MSDVVTPDAESIAVVLGTRPEIIKLAEVCRILGPRTRVVYSGQHYDDELGPAFFRELDVPAPSQVLTVGGRPRGGQIGAATEGLDAYFATNRPLAVVVQGDTNTTLAGALAANAREIPLIHVEAGLRSRDRAMPEEHNRVVTDHLADLCCAPTEVNRSNLLSEQIDPERIVVTGNTVVEALQALLPSPAERRALLDQMDLEPAGYIAATIHRPENADDPDNLRAVLEELVALPFPVVLPLHPRTAARVREFGLEPLLSDLRIVEPLGYRPFLALAAESAFLVSDSGGIQEEASVVKRPVIVVRNSTERPEVLGTFAELVQPGPAIGKIAAAWAADLPALHDRLAALPSPYGDGSASRRCVDAIDRLLGV